MITVWDAAPTFDRVFDDVMRSALGGYGTARSFTPAVDIRVTDDAIVLCMDVPGVKRDDVTVTLEHRELTVKGVRKLEASDREQMSLGRAYGDFSLSYALPDTVDGEHVSADLADGVLTICVPKRPSAQPRRIQIGSGDGGKQLAE
jgi:HSP20 family protein